MIYMPPYALLRRGLAVSPDGEAVLMSRALLRLLTATLAEAVGFDAEWYGREYRDVAEAIGNGELDSGFRHFIDCGYEEGRIPVPFSVDEGFYRDRYPEADDALANGAAESADDHYRSTGYEQGLAPGPEAEPAVLRWQEVIAQSAELVRTLGAEAAGLRD